MGDHGDVEKETDECTPLSPPLQPECKPLKDGHHKLSPSVAIELQGNSPNGDTASVHSVCLVEVAPVDSHFKGKTCD
jgi:hypothetical protein